ncbi:glutathione S-transferase N-terminal domain-containing protein [Alloalcanivorax xenomutans]|uniref:glutathione S-transferase N-terminal domain-containing protein n=1 Tax=Alloalcanivorax xenomutans TaxID=1094342 RepID=UPI003BA9070B
MAGNKNAYVEANNLMSAVERQLIREDNVVEAKWTLAKAVSDCRGALTDEEYAAVLERSCRLMSLHCGNHEELEALEAILDWLSDAESSPKSSMPVSSGRPIVAVGYSVEPSTEALTLWGRDSAFNVQKVLWLLDELELEYRHISLGGDHGGLDDPEFLAMNPHGRVPVPRYPAVFDWYQRLSERSAYRRRVLIPFDQLYGKLTY